MLDRPASLQRAADANDTHTGIVTAVLGMVILSYCVASARTALVHVARNTAQANLTSRLRLSADISLITHAQQLGTCVAR